MDAAEHDRRRGSTARVMALFLSRPNTWIAWQDIAQAGGSCAWRTRISDARKQFRKEGRELVWNRKLSSCYMLRDKAIGPAAHEYREASLF